jgi:hypothetical protein
VSPAEGGFAQEKIMLSTSSNDLIKKQQNESVKFKTQVVRFDTLGT